MKGILAAAAASLLVAAAAAAGPPARSALHTELERSTPARDTVIGTPLENVVLVFSGPVEAKLSRVRWVGPAGDTLSLEVSAVPDQPHVLVASAPPAANGAQRLLWLTVSADGHQVSGTIPFSADIPGLAEPDTTVAAAEPATGGPAADASPGRESTGPGSGRLSVGGLGMLCLLGFAGLLWFGMGTTILQEPGVHRAASALGLGATILLALDAVLWLADLRLPGTDLSSTFAIAVDTRTGLAVSARVALVAVAFLSFSGTRAVRLGAVVAMLAVVVGALGGHQATIRPLLSLPANALHMGAAAVWTGGLLLLGLWPLAAGPDRVGHGGPDTAGVAPGWTFPRVAARVSAAALLASATILVTGIAQELLYLPSPTSLVTSLYGNLLVAKSAGFIALVGFGIYNRYRLIPALEREPPGGDVRLRRSVRLELVLIVVIVIVAVALARVPPPVD